MSVLRIRFLPPGRGGLGGGSVAEGAADLDPHPGLPPGKGEGVGGYVVCRCFESGSSPLVRGKEWEGKCLRITTPTEYFYRRHDRIPRCKKIAVGNARDE
jgi:hypothetical protein